ncbi:MAG: alcohol dehydrogenase catalytic domain-containing protein [Cyanobacteria bacterium SZAS TMP-1]|nr:alcohol dehydrogenase catalytic domain-containing protein [Cyanobacteria bacterium SZAS TMP-1]
MKALVKDGTVLSVKSVERPQLRDVGDVIVKVMLAGLCRTDLYAAEGKLKTPEHLILGHEFAGIVEDAETDIFKAGDPVCVNPLLSCGFCSHCERGAHGACAGAQFIGVDRDGCFAGYIVVPATSIFRLPPDMPFLEAAYAEPVAASLAVLKVGISRTEKGVIFGSNRFSQLLQKIMRIYGFANIDLYDPISQKGQLEPSSYDYVIETAISSDIFSELVDTVKPGGKIILKSRNHEPLSFRMNEVIKKEPVFHVVNYGSFQESIDLLAGGQLDIKDLVDGVYTLEKFDSVFAGSKESESLKPFFAPWD